MEGEKLNKLKAQIFDLVKKAFPEILPYTQFDSNMELRVRTDGIPTFSKRVNDHYSYLVFKAIAKAIQTKHELGVYMDSDIINDYGEMVILGDSVSCCFWINECRIDYLHTDDDKIEDVRNTIMQAATTAMEKYKALNI